MSASRWLMSRFGVTRCESLVLTTISLPPAWQHHATFRTIWRETDLFTIGGRFMWPTISVGWLLTRLSPAHNGCNWRSSVRMTSLPCEQVVLSVGKVRWPKVLSCSLFQCYVLWMLTTDYFTGCYAGLLHARTNTTAMHGPYFFSTLVLTFGSLYIDIFRNWNAMWNDAIKWRK